MKSNTAIKEVTIVKIGQYEAALDGFIKYLRNMSFLLILQKNNIVRWKKKIILIKRSPL